MNMDSTSALSKFSTPIAIVIGATIIGAFVMVGLRGQEATSPTAGAPKVNVKDVETAGAPYIGNEKAPLTIAFWSDFQCPFCKAVEVGGVPQIPTQPSIPQIVQQYVDTGKVKIVFKDFAFLGNDSITAAEYGRAVWELYPTKYYAWREAMLHAQDEEGDVGFGDEASILKLSATISGVDVSALKELVAEKKEVYDTAISADQQEGAKFGVQGTPAFIIGTKFIGGAEQLSSFVTAIESQLK